MGFIHKEGRGTLALVAGISLAALTVLRLADVADKWVVLAAVASGILFIIVLHFFRNPIRRITPDLNAVIAPADGKIVAIERVNEEEFMKGECTLISIFMNVHNVHVNRAPVAGKVIYRKYHHGKYLVAWNHKSSLLNERTTLAFSLEESTVMMRQIAGGLARRIVTYPKEGEWVEQGSQIGFIKFGSRVDVFIPNHFTVTATLKQKVKGGITVIATVR